MDQSNEIPDKLIARSLDDNLRDLVTITNSNNFRLLLINHNSLMNDFFKGALTKEAFEVGKNKIWESLLFFITRLNGSQLNTLKSKIEPPGYTNENKRKILFIAASPKDTVPLQVGYEFDKIAIALQSGSQREQFELIQPIMAVTLEKFLFAKHQYTPYLIHFSGHAQDQGLIFSNDNNQYKLLTEDILEEMFKGIGDYTRCIVLNACYASSQAQVISRQGIYVIGMNDPIRDSSALFLSDKFYKALSNGQDIKEAFFTMKILLVDFQKNSALPDLWKDGNIVNNS